MKLITQEQALEFKSFIERHEAFLIAGHKEPDGDCIASCIGTAEILARFGKPYQMISAGPFKRAEIQENAGLFAGSLPFQTEQERKETGLIIVDCSDLSRLGDIEGDLEGFDTFIIDHHKTADVQIAGAQAIIDPTAPAAALVVQQLYEHLCGAPSKQLAETFFLGLSTDSGYFRFLTDGSGDVFRAAARLVDCGVNPKRIYNRISSGKPWSTRKLLGIMLKRAERYLDGRLAVTYETMEDTKAYGADGRDSDALYSALLATEGVRAALLVRQENETSCTLGFRSQDAVDVSAVAAKFGGGGHKNAAGAICEGKIATIIPAIIKEFARIM